MLPDSNDLIQKSADMLEPNLIGKTKGTGVDGIHRGHFDFFIDTPTQSQTSAHIRQSAQDRVELSMRSDAGDQQKNEVITIRPRGHLIDILI